MMYFLFQLKGQCQDSTVVGGITAVLEQGVPLQMIQLLQSPWEERFRVRAAPPTLPWSVNQKLPTHCPPQGIPGVGVDEILQPGWINRSPISIPTEPDQMLWGTNVRLGYPSSLPCPDNFLSVCLVEVADDTALREPRGYFLSCLLWYIRSRCWYPTPFDFRWVLMTNAFKLKGCNRVTAPYFLWNVFIAWSGVIQKVYGFIQLCF